jgi:cytochrome b
MTTFENDRLGASARYAQETASRRVWDWPVRVFHWTLVAAFIGAFVTNRLGVSYFKYHAFCGYTVLVLVAFRLVWGFVGTRHARFLAFLRGPRYALDYFQKLRKGRAPHYAGHNPLGAWMVLTLLLALGAQASFGLFANDEIFNAGPLVGLISKQHSLLLTSLHSKLFYWIGAAVVLHVAAVLIHVAIKREPLVRAMITGRKPAHIVSANEEIASSRSWVALAIFLTITAALATGLYFAPSVDMDFAGL